GGGEGKEGGGRLGRRDSQEGRAHAASGRVQAPASGGRGKGDAEEFRARPPLPDCQPLPRFRRAAAGARPRGREKRGPEERSLRSVSRARAQERKRCTKHRRGSRCPPTIYAIWTRRGVTQQGTGSQA